MQLLYFYISLIPQISNMRINHKINGLFDQFFLYKILQDTKTIKLTNKK